MDNVVDLDAWREQAIEALGAPSGVTFKPGTEAFTVPHPLLLSDWENGELDRASGALAIATVLLGGQQNYSRFVGAGGRAGDVMLAWRMMQQGVDLDPNSRAFTPSSAAAAASSNPISSAPTPANTVPSISGGGPSSVVPAS